MNSNTRNDDPGHIAAVAKMADERGCDWPGHPCGRDIPEFNGRDAECLCERLVVIAGSLEQIGRDVDCAKEVFRDLRLFPEI